MIAAVKDVEVLDLTYIIRSQSSKGIAPIVATVLLLGITISVAALMPSWTASLIDGVTTATGEQNQRLLDSGSIDLEIKQARYVAPSETVQLTVSLMSGTSDINRSLNAIALCNGETGGIKSFDDVGTLEIIEMTSHCEPDRIELSLENYPVTTRTEKLDITGFSVWSVSDMEALAQEFQNTIFNPLTLERNQQSIDESNFDGQKINTTIENGVIVLAN